MKNFWVSVRKYTDRILPEENRRKAVGFCRKNKRYFFAVILFMLLLFVLYNCTGPEHRRPGAENTEPETDGSESTEPEFVLDAEYAVDAVPEVNRLVKEYLDAYALGDMNSLEKLAYPLSDNEKSYIGVFSQYFESYQNVICYTKRGVDEGSYFVSVYYDLKFYGVETLAAGLHMFYVETDDAGQLFINNLYSQFNRDVKPEYEGDPRVMRAIQQFECQEDLAKLQQEVDAKYREAKSSDVNLATVIDVTIPTAMRNWLESQQPNQSGDTETEQPTEPEPTEPEPTETQPPETQVQPEPEPEPEPEPQPEKVRFIQGNVNIREGAGTDYDVLGQGSRGEVYTKLGESDGWTKIEYEGGEAYVKSDYLEIVTD